MRDALTKSSDSYEIASRSPRPWRGLDRRTRAWRSIRQVETAMLRAAGGSSQLTEIQSLHIRRAAELFALAGRIREAALQGDAPDLTLVVRMENAAQRALEAASAGFVVAAPPSIVARVQALQSNPAGPVSPEGDAAPRAFAPRARLDPDEGRA